MMRQDWYLIESWPGLMLTAKVEIVARGVDFRLPMSWRRAKVDGRDQPHSFPRLPGNFAFVELTSLECDEVSLNEQAAAIAGLRGVRSVYKNAQGHYARVPSRELQALAEMEADEHREAGKAKPKFIEASFRAEAKVRILRHPTMEGQIGVVLWVARGIATLAMPNGIKLPVPECDIAEIDAMRKSG